MVIFTSVMGAPVSTLKCVFRQMREDQSLPVQVEHTSVGHAVDSWNAAAALCRFKQQMHLSVMPQRLEMADAPITAR